MDFVTKLFDTSDFPPRWDCGLWTPAHGWLHILSDLAIWGAYLAIPCVLIYFAFRRKDVPFRRVFWLFGAFILACGTTHLMEAIIFWWPAYRLAGLIKLFTALVSWATVIALIPTVPKVLSMRTAGEMEREIAERKRAEEALRQANARLDLAVRGSNIGIWEIDMPDGVIHKGRVDLINLWEQFGYDRPDAPTDFATSLGLVPPEDRERLETSLQRFVLGETPVLEVEHRAGHRDGSVRWMLTRGVSWRDPAGKPVRLIGSSIDITELKQTEEMLRRNESLLTEAQQIDHIGCWSWDIRSGRLNWTEELYRVFGLDRKRQSPDHERFMAALHPDDRARISDLIDAALLGTETYDCEYRIIRPDGDVRMVRARGKVIRNEAGEAIEMIGTAHDITERHRAEEALRESEARFRGTFDNAAVGIAHKDADGRLLRLNERYCEIVGYTREELVHESFQDFTHPEDLVAEVLNFTRLMRGELSSYSMEKRYIRKDGSLIWIDVSVSLQRDAAGRPAYAIAILQDISERKRLEGELRQAKDSAEEANRAKDEFLANVSHEIRTPMNAILGMTELTLDTRLTDDQRQCLETVKSAAENLLCIINDLLDFSKIAAGKLELDPADFSLRTTLSETLRALAVRAHAKGLELVCHVQPDAPDALIGDAGRLRQVMLNLVGNAIKFTNEGEVVVRVQVTGDSAPDGEVVLGFTVRDTGIGIPPEKQGRVFHAFEQEDTSTTRKYGGTGLGLTIAARLVELMGGVITVESKPGLGSTFAFTARFGRQPQVEESSAAPAPVLLRNLPVLIVDDNATNRHILSEWVRAWQMVPTAVGDAAATMDALWHGLALNRPFALVLLDAYMPGTSGLALAAMIRERAELSATRIILLTSGDLDSVRVRSRELKINAHLLKPVPQDELLDTIDRVMNRVGAPAPAVAAREETPARDVIPLRILVAEDNEFNARHLERLLTRRGHSVRLAVNGQVALGMLGVGNQGSGDPVPEADYDLLLLDLHMPELDGFQVVRAIRERERVAGGHLPIIALTARSRKEDRERCLAAGMDDYLAKPVRGTELAAAIDRLVSSRRVSRPAPAPPEVGDRTRLIDPVVLLAACGDDAEGLHDLCLDFQAYAPARLAEVGDAFRGQDAPRLREAAHKLCGLLSVFSTVGGHLASDLEDLAARGQLDEARTLVERLETMGRELIRQVDGLSYESLRRQAETAEGPDRAAGA